MSSRRLGLLAGVGVAAVAAALVAASTGGSTAALTRGHTQRIRNVAASSPRRSGTTTPIKHVVVLFDENISFDHYFATYPRATNTDGVPFHAVAGTPRTDNLVQAGLLHGNPNKYDPFRLSPDQAMTCDQNHKYGSEQQAFDDGRMDQFVEKVSTDTCTGLYGAPGLTMGYYDGNTVTGLWNYAQRFAMSDNSFSTTFGPSTPGALNLVSGQTHGFIEVDPSTGEQVATPGSYTLASPDENGVGTVINDPDPAYDDCSDNNHTSTNTLAAGKGRNIGDLLNEHHVTWGWFQGGFAPTVPAGGGATYAVCGATHTNVGGATAVDYSPHHNPFEYYKSTANPHHLPPTSLAMVGRTDQANHQYDLSLFAKAVKAGNLPAVSFVKAAEYQDGHAGYSDPIDEQHFLVNQLNLIQHSKYWKNTAVVIAYDDSDGWYDHRDAKILNSSDDPTNDAAICSTADAPKAGGYADRCGPGTRQPLLVISPYARKNFVAHNLTEQTSILKFVEDNWELGRIGDDSFDQRAGSLKPMFDFGHRRNYKVFLRPNGTVKSTGRIDRPQHRHAA